MLAMLLKRCGTALQATEIPQPIPNADQVLIKITACAICRTDLHVVDGELSNPVLPLIPGHQIVGKITAMGSFVSNHKIGDRVGVTWIGQSCANCEYCNNNQENLCETAKFTGYTLNGGFAEYCVAKAEYCFKIPASYTDIQAAPLLCAGIIGYRAYRKLQDFNLHNVKKIGFYGFGSAAHILMQIAKYQQKQVFVFTRPDDISAQDFARDQGAYWVGDSTQAPAEQLDAAIIFAPVGALIPQALTTLRKGGIVICGGIHMSTIPAFSYDLLWGERILCSVANLTRRDGIELLELAPKVPVTATVTTYPLRDANQALQDLRRGAFSGSAVLLP